MIASKAEELLFAVFDQTTNRNHYPVKYRRLADCLQDCVLKIQSNILDANELRTDIQAHSTRRYALQTNVVSKCNQFLSLTKYSMKASLISAATGEKLTQLAHDIKYMTLAWRKS